MENEVHVIGASSLAAGHLTLVPRLREALAELGREDIVIVVVGVVPPQDYEALRDAGAAAIFDPGTVIPEAAIGILEELAERLGLGPLAAEPAANRRRRRAAVGLRSALQGRRGAAAVFGPGTLRLQPPASSRNKRALYSTAARASVPIGPSIPGAFPCRSRDAST